MEKVYLVTIKENGKLASFHEVYSSFSKALVEIQCICDAYGFQIQKTELKNEFKVYTNAGEYVHTLQIIDVWVR